MSDPLNPAEVVIKAFGGLRATARAMGLTPPSICYWRRNGIIPGRQMTRVLKIAAEKGIKLAHRDVVEGR